MKSRGPEVRETLDDLFLDDPIPPELNKKQAAFLVGYMTTWNATESARRAGYAFPREQGSRLLSHDSIRAEISRRLVKYGMSANEVMARLSEFARADISDFLKFDEFGGLTIDPDAVRTKGYLIRRIKFTRDGPELELHDPLTALDKLGRIHAMFTENVKIPGPIELRVVYDEGGSK